MKPQTSKSEEEKEKLAKGSNTSQGKTGVDAVESRSTSIVRSRDGSGFVKCDECHESVIAALISNHTCSLEAKNRMILETHVVEQPKPERKKRKSSESKAKRAKVEKKVKDPNVPKKPPTAFFLFMADFRKSFKEANPDSKVDVSKEGGKRWSSMTDEEKKPYSDKVAELKAEYDKAMESYNAAEEGGEEGEGEGEHEEGADEKSDKEEAAAGEEEELTDED